MNLESMDELDAAMDPEALQSLYAKTAYLLRESRKTLLKNYGVEDEAALLDRIRQGDVSEHPAYDHYLSALIMEQTRLQVRADMLAKFGGAPSADETLISVHLLLQEQLETHYAHRLSEPIRMAQDALLLSFDNGLMMEVRYFSREEYALNWCWGEAELRIDTAPTHPDCATFPQHVHSEDGVISADPITQPGTECWVNFSRLLDLLLVNPLLGQL